jgi:putative superfamily III holin-X
MAEQYSSLPNAFSRVITDLADLMQKEMRLARAELSEKLSLTIRAGVWMSVAGALAIVAALLVVQSCVLGLSAASGIALHWSSLIVAALLAAAGGAAFAKGKADVPDQVAPDRALNQVKQDIAVAKEQFT